MTRVAIPEVEDTLPNLTLERCQMAVRQALAQGEDADQVRTILAEVLERARRRGRGCPSSVPRSRCRRR